MSRNYEGYDFTSEKLDETEKSARHDFGIDILNWQRFRYLINSGTDTEKIKWLSGNKKDEVVETYLDLGKMNHETLCSLAASAYCAANINYASWSQLRFLSKGFYTNAGCFLDSLASLIYTICDPFALTKTQKIETGQIIPFRRYIDWGPVFTRIKNSDQYVKHYKPIVSKYPYEEIILIRHALTHSWQPPIKVEESIPKWSLRIRKSRIFYWPHDKYELRKLDNECPDWKCIITMIREDQAALEALLRDAYAQLETDWKNFCQRSDVGIEIID